MQLLIDPSGNIRCLYGEMLDLTVLGHLAVRRASFVEPDICGNWFADLSPVSGPCLGPFVRRSEALEAERRWLEDNWLTSTPATASRAGCPFAHEPCPEPGTTRSWRLPASVP
jgi:hypothetical protein